VEQLDDLLGIGFIERAHLYVPGPARAGVFSSRVA
jgi:hypothetical protein